MTPELELLNTELALCSPHSLWCADENIGSFTPTCFIGQALCNRYDIARHLSANGTQTTFCDFDFGEDTLNNLESIVFRIAKEKAINLHIISQAFKYLKSEGQLKLIGFKNEGINSLIKKISTTYDCTIDTKKLKSQLQLINIHSAGPQDFSLSDTPYLQLSLQSVNSLEFMSKPGIFGWNKIDKGSELLIAAFDEAYTTRARESVRVLDMGCGYGYLAIRARQLGFNLIDATDNNAAAINACVSNFKFYNIEGTVDADDFGEGLTTKYDIVLSNPPFHQGFDHSKKLTERFTRQTYRLLKPGGEAYVVTNQFIGIEKIAGKLFESTHLLLKKDGFKVFVLKK